jgi:hypothetical protein
VRDIQVDFDFVAAIGGHGEVDIGELQCACGGAMAGVLGNEIGGADGGVVGDGLVDSVVNVVRILFLCVGLDLEIVLDSMFEGVLGSPSEVAVCTLETFGGMK